MYTIRFVFPPPEYLGGTLFPKLRHKNYFFGDKVSPQDLHFTFSYLLLAKTTCVLLQLGHLRFSQEHRTAIN